MPHSGTQSGPDAPRGGAPEVGVEIPEQAFDALLGVLADQMGVKLIEASIDRVVGTMPVKGNTQPFGLLHGGASCVLAETLGSIGATAHAAQLFGGLAVGVDISATHHRSARRGTITGVATPLYLGRTVASYEIVITNDGGARLCTARLTCALRRR